MDERETGTPAGSEPEQAPRELEKKEASTARSQSVVHFIDRNPDDAARMLSGLLERSSEPGPTPRILVVVPTSDDALALNEALAAPRVGGTSLLTPISSVARGRRQLAAGAVAIAGAPNELSALIAQSAIPMAGLQTLVLVWPEELLSDDRLPQLESIVSEVPKTTERLALSASRSPELTQFLERVMWRARTVDHATRSSGPSTVSVQLLAAPPSERVRALRAVLDSIDPQRAIVLAFSDEGEKAAREAVVILGLSTQPDLLQVGREIPTVRVNLAVLFDDVPTADTLGSIAAVAEHVVAIVRPTRVAALRKVAGDVRPFVWSGAATAARSAQDALREEIRGNAVTGGHLPWVQVIEPLLADLDPVEVAASAVALLDRERRRVKRAAATGATPAVSVTPPMRDARPGSAGPRSSPRRDDDRGARPFAAKRRDEGTRERPFRDRGERPGAPRDRGERSGSRPGSRDDTRGGRPARDAGGRDKRGRRDDIERVPRAAHEGAEWSERSERLRNARRGPRGGEDR